MHEILGYEIKVIDLWLSPNCDIEVGLLLARVDDRDVGDGIESRFSSWGARAAVLAKGLEGAFPSCPAMSTLICSISLLLYRTFISTY